MRIRRWVWGLASRVFIAGRRDGRRPDGLTLVPCSLGKTVAWDVTCVSRMASSNIRYGILPGANAATEAEYRKRSHYADLPSSVRFKPIAIETLGGIGRSSLAFLKEVALRIQEVTAEKLSFKYLKQRIDLTVQRGNAGCILEAIS